MKDKELTANDATDDLLGQWIRRMGNPYATASTNLSRHTSQARNRLDCEHGEDHCLGPHKARRTCAPPWVRGQRG